MNAMMKREMTETDFFHFVEDAAIFALSDFEILTKRTFRRIARNQRFINIGHFIACILLMAQASHNDIFEKDKSMNVVDAVETIITSNIMKLAQKLNVSAFLRYCMFSSDEFLSRLRKMHEDLYLVFEKYCAKGAREIALTLTMEQMANLLLDAKLIPDENAIDLCAGLYEAATIGSRSGRSLPEGIDLPPPPDDEFTFAEFLEAVCRITFVEEGSLESKTRSRIMEELIDTCIKIKELLYYVEPEAVPTKAYGKK